MKKLDFIPCRQCIGQPKGTPSGYIRKDVDGGYNYIECSCHISHKKENEAYKRFQKNGFDEQLFSVQYPKDYLGNKSKINIDRIVNYTEQYLINSEVRRCLLYLWGPNGTQKSTVAHFIGSSLLKKDVNVKYILMHRLVSALTQDSFSETKSKEIEELKKADLLIIDEAFDMTKTAIAAKSAYQVPFFDAFFRQWIMEKGVIIISNNTIDDIPEIYGQSLKDLVRRLTKKNNTFLTFEDNWEAVLNENEIPTTKGDLF